MNTTALQLDLPPGFTGMPVTENDTMNARFALGVSEKAAVHTGRSTEDFAAALLTLTPELKSNGVRVFGKFAAGDSPEYLATLSLAVLRWPDADTEMLTLRRNAVAEALLDVHRKKHPLADARVIRLPIGPAMAAVEAGEYRLPPEFTGRPTENIRAQAKVEYQIPLPDSDYLAVLVVTAESETGWPAVAEAASRVAYSLRPSPTEA
ncbi:hypothetical protein [Amycolatopsis sp. WAC 01416]|uniref:hypothetical protein n=1 Tax=Amycolatopsis sp. WAC 01416 TaxID=2203196 RepID=UPI000F7B46E8|nr:hypothetical protein [Amycolatopsis sp. WAC 01416]